LFGRVLRSIPLRKLCLFFGRQLLAQSRSVMQLLGHVIGNHGNSLSRLEILCLDYIARPPGAPRRLPHPFAITPSRFNSTFATTVHAATSAASIPGGSGPSGSVASFSAAAASLP
jgi:hypothetical protein